MVLAVTAAGFLVVDSAAEAWNPFNGRYYNIPVAIAFPLMASIIQTRSRWRAALTVALILLGLITMFTVELKTGELQRIGWTNPFTRARFAPSWRGEFNYRMVLENVPANASIGVDSTADFRDYPFFGENFGRRVTLAMPSDKSLMPRGDPRRFVAGFDTSDFLFLAGGQSLVGSDLAEKEFRLLSVHDADSLWIRRDLRPENTCDGERWPFRDFFESSSEAICPQFPVVPGTVSNGFVQSSLQSGAAFVPVIGVGSHARFQFDLLVKAQANAGLTIQVQSRHKSGPQTLVILISGTHSGASSFTRTFVRRANLNFSVPLEPDTYTVQLSLASGDQASVTNIRVSTP
jgi:hypothetical protein